MTGGSRVELDVEGKMVHGRIREEEGTRDPQTPPSPKPTPGAVPSPPPPTPLQTSASGDGFRDPLVPAWTKATLVLHKGMAKGVTACATSAARNPKTYLSVITLISLVLGITGLLTNFEIILDMESILTPVGSRPRQHASWIGLTIGGESRPDDKEVGFPHQVRTVQMVFHAHGQNVLQSTRQVRRVLEAVEVIQTTPQYQDVCAQGAYVSFDGEMTCRIMSVSNYWKPNNARSNQTLLETFDEQFQEHNSNITALHKVISQRTFADGSPVLADIIVGNYQRQATGLITTAQSFLVMVELPETPDSNDFEADMLTRLNDLRESWMDLDGDDDDNGKKVVLTMDIMSMFAFQLEIFRTILGDLYLVPICITLMVGFTCAMFYRHHNPVASRSMLGLASVITICMSMLTGNGIMFILGVPYSAVHQMLPFVIFGIGLDDTFIITGAYFRISASGSQASLEDRIRTTFEEVGPSICLTTITTVFAFMLGYFTSSLPGVHWLCLYAIITIAVDFFYQVTYFVAFLVLDERRIAADRKDCCFWVVVEEDDGSVFEVAMEEIDVDVIQKESISLDQDEAKEEDDDEEEEEEEELDPPSHDIAQPHPKTAAKVQTATNVHNHHFEDSIGFPVRIMRWYSHFLLRPYVRAAVLVFFSVFFCLCLYSATLMKQHFNVAEYMAQDSYLTNIFSSLDDYSSVVAPMGVYFRFVDQMDVEVQQQMINYVDELERLDQIGGATNASLSEALNSDEVRPFCWVRDIPLIIQEIEDPIVKEVVQNMTFREQLDFALNNKVFREIYGQDIMRDEFGNITASRCFLFLKNLDLESVEAQIEMLADQRAVTKAQPMNQVTEHQSSWRFFAFQQLFFYWEAYTVAVEELVFTIIAGVVAVTLVAVIFIPHWTAAFIVLPLIIVLYVDLLGTIRFFGLQINGLTYVCVVVAIGLLVDFVMHILLRYYETSPYQSREERVKETLQTIGVSIWIGGFTTLLGVIPLALSSMKIFLTVFYAFFAMVTLGLAHGLILLPVLLSLVGPKMAARGHHVASTVRPPGFRVADGTEGQNQIQQAKTTAMNETGDWGSTWFLHVTDEIEC